MTEIQKFDIIETANPVLTVAPIEEETEMLGATDKITALYCRLSVEDLKEGKNGEKADESNSIQTQKMILLQYAKQNHFPNPTFFVDDGYSGVDFDNRPDFQRMLTEVNAGRVGTIITKDLSRLGRNSALTSLYINIAFPKSGVRYIGKIKSMKTVAVTQQFFETRRLAVDLLLNQTAGKTLFPAGHRTVTAQKNGKSQFVCRFKHRFNDVPGLEVAENL